MQRLRCLWQYSWKRLKQPFTWTHLRQLHSNLRLWGQACDHYLAHHCVMMMFNKLVSNRKRVWKSFCGLIRRDCCVQITTKPQVWLFILSTALKQLNGVNNFESEREEMELERVTSLGKQVKKPWELFTDRSLRWQLLTIILLNMAQQLNGINAVCSLYLMLPCFVSSAVSLSKTVNTSQKY